ncbi:hypothetical protein NUW58_g2342 [Xylaria curta]|uniref:Uncharacterized protein n=1 Tax=Xylaria curta TaxID=42375 RepID=A0ACC1PH89_9PEZI|nr:hypothetical protein NUW58_g2342 [Xylaria curta]
MSESLCARVKASLVAGSALAIVPLLLLSESMLGLGPELGFVFVSSVAFGGEPCCCSLLEEDLLVCSTSWGANRRLDFVTAGLEPDPAAAASCGASDIGAASSLPATMLLLLPLPLLLRVDSSVTLYRNPKRGARRVTDNKPQSQLQLRLQLQLGSTNYTYKHPPQDKNEQGSEDENEDKPVATLLLLSTGISMDATPHATTNVGTATTTASVAHLEKPDWT